MKRIGLLLLSVLLAFSCCAAYAAQQGSVRFEYDQGGAMGIEWIYIQPDEEAGIMNLWPVDTIYNVVLDELQMEEDTLWTRTVYTAAKQESNQVICLQAWLWDALPRFRVTFVNSNGETERWYLADSGEDGSLLLLPPQTVEVYPMLDSDLLVQAEEKAALLQQMLVAATSLEEMLQPAEEMLLLWQEVRIARWGGYAQSMYEQEWLLQREASAGSGVIGILDQAEMTRYHVYELMHCPLPENE